MTQFRDAFLSREWAEELYSICIFFFTGFYFVTLCFLLWGKDIEYEREINESALLLRLKNKRHESIVYIYSRR